MNFLADLEEAVQASENALTKLNPGDSKEGANQEDLKIKEEPVEINLVTPDSDEMEINLCIPEIMLASRNNPAPIVDTGAEVSVAGNRSKLEMHFVESCFQRFKMGNTQIISRKICEYKVLHTLLDGSIQARKYRVCKVDLDIPLLIVLEYCRFWVLNLRERFIDDDGFQFRTDVSGSHVYIPQPMEGPGRQSITSQEENKQYLLMQKTPGHLSPEGIIQILASSGKEL